MLATYLPIHEFYFTGNEARGGDTLTYWEATFAQPYFDNATRRDVTATAGQAALLHCRVRNLGDRAVSIEKISH